MVVLKEWLVSNFDVKEPLTAAGVSTFIACGIDISDIISELDEDELVWLLVFDIIENEKYKQINLNLSTKLFVVQAQKVFAEIEKTLSITDDIEAIWNKSGAGCE